MTKLKIIRATTIPRSLNVFCKGMLHDLSQNYDVIGVSSPGDELDEVSKREGVKVISVPMERHISLTRDLKSLFSMFCVFRKEKPQVVHSMTPKAGLICMVAAWLAKVPVRIHTFTGLVWPTAKGIQKHLLMATDMITCACATHIIPEGEGVKNDLLEQKITNKPLEVLGFGNVKGVDMEFYSSERIKKSQNVAELLAEKGDNFIFLFVGRIVGDKGINELCHAFASLHMQYHNTKLCLVGRYEDKLDPISSETRAIIDDSKNGIIIVGEKYGDDLLAYYTTSDCFVFPSYREGFPNTVLEAGAMGLPSIVTDINGSREIIKDGMNGIIVPPRNEERLFNAMLKMLQSSVDRNKMAGNARQMIADRFEQGYVRQCLYDFYDKILNNNNNELV